MRIIVRTDWDLIPKSEFQNPQLRKGVTLTEVLIAMFVLAIGMMGVLALFPLGAAQMANAVKDERTSQTAQVVEGHARLLWRAWYPSAATRDYAPSPGTPTFQAEPALQAFDNPDPLYEFNPLPQPNALIAPNSTEASFPIYFDPIGRAFQPTVSAQHWVGNIANGLPRRSLKTITSLPLASQNVARIRLLSLIDDLSYDSSGNAAVPVQRGGRYNAAFLIQRPFNGSGNNNSKANLTIVVYQNRPVSDTPGVETVLALDTIVSAGSTNLSFPKAGIPSLRKGGWILLTGHIRLKDPTRNPVHPEYGYANFYRIVSVQDNGTNFMLEVSPPFKPNPVTNLNCQNQPMISMTTGAATTTTATDYPVNVIAVDNVAEVFDRPMLMPGN